MNYTKMGVEVNQRHLVSAYNSFQNNFLAKKGFLNFESQPEVQGSGL